MPTTLTLTRRGSFTVEEADIRHTQCGIKGTDKFYYRVEITCTPEALDENGFLIDQLEIRQYMIDRHKQMDVFPSCERLALRCIEEILPKCRGVKSMTVTIGSGPNAFMTAKWDAEDA